MLFGLAIRNLSNSLLQLYPELYVSDLPWLSSLIDCMEKHKDKALRLQGEVRFEIMLCVCMYARKIIGVSIYLFMYVRMAVRITLSLRRHSIYVCMYELTILNSDNQAVG